MTDEVTPEPTESESAAKIQIKLQALAAELRQAGHLNAETQRALASLLNELGTEFGSTGIASPSSVHLADAVSDVARSLHQQHSAGLVATARDKLRDAAARAEVEAPVASGVVYRLLDVLSGIGI